MKLVFTFLFLQLFYISFSQQKNEIGFYIAPLKQSAFKNNNSLKVTDDFSPFASISIETGLFYKRIINTKFSIQHNVHFGILYHSLKTITPTTTNRSQTVIGVNEAAYNFGYTPNIVYTPFSKNKNFQIIGGILTKYYFDAFPYYFDFTQLQNGATYEETLFVKGSFLNNQPNIKHWQFATEIGFNYDINLIKKRVLLKINPFYQHSFNTVYTGVYRYTKGTYTENGNFKNKVHQTGVRLLFGFKF